MTEWGSLALVDEGQGDSGNKMLALPGVQSGDFSSRHWRPEVRVSAVHFSPTGECGYVKSILKWFGKRVCKEYY